MYGTLRTLIRSFAVLLLLGAPALAQEYRYSVYIDTDSDISTGCSEAYPNAPGQAEGAEFRLTAVVSGDPPMVQQVLQSLCSGGSFGTDVQIDGGYPVALNSGVGGSDGVEMAVAAGPLGGSGARTLRLEVGDETFFEILSTYAERFRYGNATTNDFVALAQEVSGMPLDALFYVWLFGDTVPPPVAIGLG